MQPSPPTVVLLAAGLGTRLRSGDGDPTPKCLRPVAGRPFIAHILDRLVAQGIERVIVNLHYRQDEVRAAVEGWNSGALAVNYHVEHELLGTAGTVRAVAVRSSAPLVVWYADNCADIDLRALLRAHEAAGADATLTTFYRDTVRHSGLVTFDNHGRIHGFVEKPTAHRGGGNVNAGIYVVEPGLVRMIPERGPSDFGRDVFPRALAAGLHLRAHPLTHEEGLWWIDTLADLDRVRAAMER